MSRGTCGHASRWVHLFFCYGSTPAGQFIPTHLNIVTSLFLTQTQGSKDKKGTPGSGDESKGEDGSESPSRDPVVPVSTGKLLHEADDRRSISDRSSSPLDVTSSHTDIVSHDQMENRKLVAVDGPVGELLIKAAGIASRV